MDITGVVQNVDTIAQVQAALAANNRVATDFEIVGIGTDFFLTTQSDIANAPLIGGEDEAARLDTQVRLTAASGQYTVLYYGSDSPAAHRSTLTELQAAWDDVRQGNGNSGGGVNSPGTTLTGSGAAKVQGAIPTRPTGGSNYVPPSPIEFLVRGADEADGKNIEVRYHADHDTLQEILDASLVSAQNPDGAKVIAVFGTDLAVAPEEPPVTRRMYPEGGTAAGGGGTFDLTPVQEGITLGTGGAVFGPAMSALHGVFWLEFTYTRSGDAGIKFLTAMRKSEIGASSSSPFPLQLQGGDGLHIDLYEANDNLTFGALPAGYSAASVSVFNPTGAGGEDTSGGLDRDAVQGLINTAIASLRGNVAADRDTLAELAAAIAAIQPGATWLPPSADAPSGGADGNWTVRTGAINPGIYYRSGGNWARVVAPGTGDGSAYVLPAATETTLGGVRNVSVDEASNTAATVFRAWSSAMISKLVNLLWGPPGEAEARAGTATVNRLWTAALVRAAINAVVPAVFRTGNTDRIPLDKLPELDDSLIEKLYDDTVAANGAIFTVDGVTIENDANQAYYIRVGATSAFTLGNALFAATSSAAVTVDGVRFWTVGDALRIGPTSTEKAVTVWKVDDLAAIRSTVQQAITQPATWARDGNTDDIPDAKIPAGIARDSEIADSVTGLSENNGVLTGTRRSGANPIQVNLGNTGGRPASREEQVAFQDVPSSSTTDTELTPAATSPLSVPYGTGPNRFLSGISGNDFTLAAGLYLVKVEGEFTTNQNARTFGFHIRRASDNAVLSASSQPGTRSEADAAFGALALLALDQPTAVNIYLVRYGATISFAELKVQFAEWGGAAAGGAAGASENPEETTIAGDTTVRFQAENTLNPDGYRSGQTVATPEKIGLLTAGSSLAPYASALSQTDDTVTLEAGLYIATFQIAIYSSSSSGNPETTNARYNTHHEARALISGNMVVISTDLSNAYVRPIGSGADQQYGGYRRAIIMRVPAKGPIDFRHALTGQTTTGYLGCRSITIYRIAGPARTLDTRPSISRFDLAGDLSPLAGAISETYTATWSVAQSSHLSALRIVRFTGTDAAPAAVTVLATIAAADWHGGSQEISVTGFNLAAGATETVRIEGYGAGQTPATDQPVTYHDVRVTAHAPATAAVRFIRVPRQVGSPAARPTAATLVAALAETGAGVMATGATAIRDWEVSGIPGTGQWLVGWIVAQSAPQPNHFTQAGIQIDAAVAARFAFAQNSVDYYVYLFADTNYVDNTYNGSTITVT